MVHCVLRITWISMAVLLTACGTQPFRIDGASSASDDPILLTPGTTGPSGGPVRVPLPEFTLDSDGPLPLSVVVDKSEFDLTLKMSFGKLYADVPQHSFEPLAKTPALPAALYTALKSATPMLRSGGTVGAARLALAMSLAERLPRHNSNAWGDAYNYDPELRALALVPGMRLRLETMYPVTADAGNLPNLRSQGSIMPPSYLNILPAEDGASVVLAPTLEKLAIRSEDTCTYADCLQWRDASGVHNLLGKVQARWRFWSLFYPASLGEVGHLSGPLQFVNEERMSRPEDGVPAVLLVGTANAQDMSKFIETAKAKRTSLTPEMLPLISMWKEATKRREAAAISAKLKEDELVALADDENTLKTEEQRVAVNALKSEQNALSNLKSANDKVGINCSITTPSVAGCFILRYRVLPVPEILVTVQGIPLWVEIGTTVGMALASHESIRTTASYAGSDFSEGDSWRNRQSRIPLDQIKFSRMHMGARSRVVVQPDVKGSDDAIRRITLQPGDEIKWSN